VIGGVDLPRLIHLYEFYLLYISLKQINIGIIYDSNILLVDCSVALFLIKTGNLFGYSMYHVRIFYFIFEFYL